MTKKTPPWRGVVALELCVESRYSCIWGTTLGENKDQSKYLSNNNKK